MKLDTSPDQKSNEMKNRKYLIRIILFLLMTFIYPNGICAQEQFGGLEFEYTDYDKYHLVEGFYTKAFVRSALTWSKADCGHFPYEKLARLASEGIYLNGSCVYIRAKYVDELKGILTRFNEYIVVDVIQDLQYPCNDKNKFNASLSSRGYLLQPVFRSDIKNVEGDFCLGKLPVVPNHNIFFNVYLKKTYRCIGNGCCCIAGSTVNGFRLDSLLREHTIIKIPLLRFPTDSIKNEVSVSLRVEFSQHSAQIDSAYINQFHKLLPKSAEIKNIKIAAYSSVEGTPEINEKLQKERAQNIVNLLRERFNGDYHYSLTLATSLQQFKDSIAETSYDSLKIKSLSQLQLYLKDEVLSTALEPFLCQGRFAQVDLVLKNKIGNENIALLSDLYRNSIQQGELSQALYFQAVLLSYGIEVFELAEIPFSKSAIPIWTNAVIPYYGLSEEDNTDVDATLADLYYLDKKNCIANYNYVVTKLNQLIDQHQKNYNIVESLKSNRVQMEFLRNNPSSKNLDLTQLESTFTMLSAEVLEGESDRKSTKKLAAELKTFLEAYHVAYNYKKQFRWFEAAELLNSFTKLHFDELAKMKASIFKTQYLALLLTCNYQAGGFDKTKDLENAVRWIYQTDPTFFCELFQNKTLSHRILESKFIKNFYCESCN